MAPSAELKRVSPGSRPPTHTCPRPRKRGGLPVQARHQRWPSKVGRRREPVFECGGGRNTHSDRWGRGQWARMAPVGAEPAGHLPTPRPDELRARLQGRWDRPDHHVPPRGSSSSRRGRQLSPRALCLPVWTLPPGTGSACGGHSAGGAPRVGEGGTPGRGAPLLPACPSFLSHLISLPSPPSPLRPSLSLTHTHMRTHLHAHMHMHTRAQAPCTRTYAHTHT